MKKKPILQGHKRIGKRLIPPIMQLENIKEVPFIDNTLPSLIWMSSLFLRAEHTEVVSKIIDFIKICDETAENGSHFAFLNNMYTLGKKQKKQILAKTSKETLVFFRKHLAHQYYLFKNKYPLGFIFDNPPKLSKDSSVTKLMEEVDLLLNRFNLHSTKVQTTAYVSMLVTGKIKISSDINFPHPDIIFTSPQSEEANRVASHVRAALNVIPLFESSDTETLNKWANLFWKTAFNLKGCI